MDAYIDPENAQPCTGSDLVGDGSFRIIIDKLESPHPRNGNHMVALIDGPGAISFLGATAKKICPLGATLSAT